MNIPTKLSWYFKNLLNLGIASVRIFLYCIVHPRSASKLAFAMFSTINEFYQYSHGKLLKFEQSPLYADIVKSQVFAKCNYFNFDTQVSRPVEAQILSALTLYLNPKTIFEIGTYNGFTTLHFAYNSAPSTKIYTLDLPPDYSLKSVKGTLSYDDYLVVELSKTNIANRIFKNHPGKEKIIELFGDSLTFDYTPYHGKIDLIFIDGNHAHDFVKSDTENALKMLSPNGVIVWHDFDYIIHRDVFKYLNNLSATKRIYSIAHTRFAIYGKPIG